MFDIMSASKGFRYRNVWVMIHYRFLDLPRRLYYKAKFRILYGKNQEKLIPRIIKKANKQWDTWYKNYCNNRG